MATNSDKKTDGNLIASQMFAEVFQAYLECSDEVQAAVRDMVEIVNDREATPEETQAALSTIAEALFPQAGNGWLGVDLEESERQAPDSVAELLRKMNEQEATFAARVQAALDEKGITQVEFAESIGVGQPAVSMMLSRKCRPQKRTIQRIAAALSVVPEDLWPDLTGE